MAHSAPDLPLPRTVFVTGGTGHVGRHLIPLLAGRGHRVIALVRPVSRWKLPPEADPAPGSALASWSYAHRVAPADTFVHLVGARRYGGEEQFRDVDLPALEASLEAAQRAGVAHFVFVSTARSGESMPALAAVHAECEVLIQASGINSTILRPGHVAGTGHRWPSAFLAAYDALDRIPATAHIIRRAGFLTLDEITVALTYAVEYPALGERVLESSEIRALASRSASYA